MAGMHSALMDKDGIPLPWSETIPPLAVHFEYNGMISVVVPAYNAGHLLGRCLRALQAQDLPTGDYEIIVVDDGSADDTSRVAAAMGARVIRIPHGGPAVARNAGLQAARGEIVLFTDPDCEPAPHWARSLAAAFTDPEVVGAKGTYLTRQRALIARFVQIEYETRYSRMARSARIDFIDTYSAGYRRSVVLQNGGFDPIFSEPTGEDQELSFRLAAKGYRLVFVPQAQVYHHHVTSPFAYFRRKYRIGRGKALMLRWLPEKAVSDSHTPQTLKIQIATLGIAGMAALGGVLWPPLWWLAAISLGGFTLSAVPFLCYAWRRDRAVALIALPMLAVRAAALGAGLLAGAIRFARYPEPRRPTVAGAQRVAKRLVDIIGALVGLTLALPLFLILALAIRLDSPGPVIDSRMRVGAHGRLFRMYRLRTTHSGGGVSAEGGTVVEGSAQAGIGEGSSTRVGRWLRRRGLDALPQFVNVLRGEMSLVGPCPEEPRLVPLYADEQRRRLLMRPGMTGPAQLDTRDRLSLQERLALEVDYVDRYSLRRDLSILWRAVTRALRGKRVGG